MYTHQNHQMLKLVIVQGLRSRQNASLMTEMAKEDEVGNSQLACKTYWAPLREHAYRVLTLHAVLVESEVQQANCGVPGAGR